MATAPKSNRAYTAWMEAMEAARANRLLVGKGGLYGNVIRIAPSMLISKEEIDDGCRRLGKALAEVP